MCGFCAPFALSFHSSRQIQQFYVIKFNANLWKYLKIELRVSFSRARLPLSFRVCCSSSCNQDTFREGLRKGERGPKGLREATATPRTILVSPLPLCQPYPCVPRPVILVLTRATTAPDFQDAVERLRPSRVTRLKWLPRIYGTRGKRIYGSFCWINFRHQKPVAGKHGRRYPRNSARDVPSILLFPSFAARRLPSPTSVSSVSAGLRVTLCRELSTASGRLALPFPSMLVRTTRTHRAPGPCLEINRWIMCPVNYYARVAEICSFWHPPARKWQDTRFSPGYAGNCRRQPRRETPDWGFIF